MLTAPAQLTLGAAVAVQVATVDQLQDSVTQTGIGSLFVGERGAEYQVPGNCLVPVAGCTREADAVPRVA
jgi:porphobilinogen deaminase